MAKTVTGRIVSIGVSNDVEVEMIGGIKKIVYVNPKIMDSLEVGEVISWDEDRDGKQI